MSRAEKNVLSLQYLQNRYSGGWIIRNIYKKNINTKKTTTKFQD